MPMATYQDLCIDAADASALGRFWALLLGWDLEVLDDGLARLRDGDRTRIWLNPVPEPVTVKNRLHLDVNAESLEPALAAGAEVVDESHRWTVLRDPDGQVFCLFVREEPVTGRLYEIGWDVTGDADDAHRLATWWGDLLGARVVDGDGYSWLEDVPGTPFETIDFAPVPEPKTTKNRIHLDVSAEALEPLLAAGATRLRPKGDDGLRWHVMADPAGNEFCAFTPD